MVKDNEGTARNENAASEFYEAMEIPRAHQSDAVTVCHGDRAVALPVKRELRSSVSRRHGGRAVTTARAACRGCNGSAVPLTGRRRHESHSHAVARRPPGGRRAGEHQRESHPNEAGFHARLYERYCDKLRESPQAYVRFVKRLQPIYGYTFEDFAPARPGAEVRADCGVSPERVAAMYRELARTASAER